MIKAIQKSDKGIHHLRRLALQGIQGSQLLGRFCAA